MPTKARATFALVLGLILCISPYARRLRNPSLYADDVDRVAQLQTEPLRTLLFAPFNEHLAPLFQVVSWSTWQLSGHSLSAARWGFTIASFVPFVFTLALLARVLNRETRSAGATLTALAVFSVSWLAVETVYWYSASSFMWSLLCTLAAWDAAETSSKARRGWSALASAAAPAFSMIGILAGPIAAVRVLATSGIRAWREALAPLAGTALFLVIYVLMYHRAAPSTDADLGRGLIAATQAPAASLVPAVIGVRTLSTEGIQGVLLALVTLGAVVGCLLRCWYRPEERAVTLGGLALIGGGYVLTFCPRAGGSARVLETQRYHLFPMLGLVFVLTPWLRRGFQRWESRPDVGLAVGVFVAALLLATHQNEMKGRARFLRFAEQPATLAALDRLGVTCDREGITRSQALAALEPTFADWAPAGRSVLVMLGRCAQTSRVPTERVRAVLAEQVARGDALKSLR